MIKNLKCSKNFYRQRLMEGVLVIFLLIAFLRHVMEPLLNLNRELNTQLMQVKSRISALKPYLSSLPKDKAMVPLKKNLKGVDISQALLEIQKLADETEIKIENVRLKDVQEVKNGYVYLKTPVELGVYGCEVALGRFMAGLEKLRFLCHMTRLTIRADSKDEDKIRSLIKLEKIDLIKSRKLGSSFDFGPYPLRVDMQQTGNRRLFKAPLVLTSKNVRVSLDGRGDVIKDLNLVGIIQDDERKAVIEDRKTSKTYFLSVSDTISDMKVTDIKENEVILEIGSAQYSLTL